MNPLLFSGSSTACRKPCLNSTIVLRIIRLSVACLLEKEILIKFIETAKPLEKLFTARGYSYKLPLAVNILH
nr:MAG TPA: hypothetical protein [Bacteriophage sp.]